MNPKPMPNDLLSQAREALDYLSHRMPDPPLVAVVLGSGMGALAGAVENPVVVPFEAIPYFPVSTVPGHAGKLVYGRLAGIQVVEMQGRFHFY